MRIGTTAIGRSQVYRSELIAVRERLVSAVEVYTVRLVATSPRESFGSYEVTNYSSGRGHSKDQLYRSVGLGVLGQVLTKSNKLAGRAKQNAISSI